MSTRGHRITLAHTFETAHRLPHLGGKCRNVHGHSWRVEVTVAAPVLSGDGTVVEFGSIKQALRGWIDEYLDHGAMLGAGDSLLAAFEADGSKVFRFGASTGDSMSPETLAADLSWPTVENVAVLLSRVGGQLLMALPDAANASIARVTIDETAVNRAEHVLEQS